MNRVRTVRSLLVALPVALGFAALAAADQSGNSDPSQPTSDSSSSSQVMVNGQKVSPDADGQATVALPQGEAQVEQEGNQTTVTLTNPATGSRSVISGNGNLNVSVQSNENGNSSFSNTQVNSFSSSFDAHSGNDSTTVITNGQTHVYTSP